MNYKAFFIMALSTLLVTLASCQKVEENLDYNSPVDNLLEVSAFPIVGTNQTTSFNNSSTIAGPSVGDDFYGQNSFSHALK